jgi:hypothetical protein
MLCLVRPLVALVTALALSLAGAFAMPVTAGSGLMPMVICADEGARTIWLDAEGNPVPAPQHDCRTCPKCLSANIDGIAPRPVATAGFVALASRRSPLLQRDLPAPDRDWLCTAPRGPPSADLPADGHVAAFFEVPVSAIASPDSRHVMRRPSLTDSGRLSKDARA